MMEIQPIQMPVSLTQGPILPIAPITVDSAQNAAEVSPSSFKELLKKAVGDLNDSQIGANGAIQNLAIGGEDNLHDVEIAMEKADLTLQYAIGIRNKVLEAYQSIIQMQL